MYRKSPYSTASSPFELPDCFFTGLLSSSYVTTMLVFHRIKCVIQGPLHRSDNAQGLPCRRRRAFTPSLGTLDPKLLKSVPILIGICVAFHMIVAGLSTAGNRVQASFVAYRHASRLYGGHMRTPKHGVGEQYPSSLSAQFQPRRFHVDLVHPSSCVVYSSRGRPSVVVCPNSITLGLQLHEPSIAIHNT